MEHKLSQADSTLLSAQQQNEIKALKDAWNKANAAGDKQAMAQANRQAEAIRAQAGYQGGSDGSGYTQLGQNGRPAAIPGAGQSAAQVQKWVDDYEYLNYSDRDGWVNGFSTAMNVRSMANYIRQQMEANSAAWKDADEAGKAYLHDQNQQLAQILEQASGGTKSTFNEQLGRWETDNSNLGYGYDTGRYNDVEFAKNVYGMTPEQMEAYRSDTSRYKNYVDQSEVRNWVDDTGGYTGIYAQFIGGPYGQLLHGTNYVDPKVYTDVIGDGFEEREGYAPTLDAAGNIVAKAPPLKNNNNMSDYTRQFASYVDENGVIQPGILIKTHPGGGPKGGSSGGGMNPGHGMVIVPTGPESGMLDQWQQAAKEQAVTVRDHAVDKAVLQLLQAQKEAQGKYQTQRDQISKDERNALDNAALYAEARGDRGGIGHTQYNQIMAAADANRQAVNSAQAQLAADTARQIAQLRAEGEFQKADDLLEISQTYLLKLLELEKWAAAHQLNRDKFQDSIHRWQTEFALKAAKALV